METGCHARHSLRGPVRYDGQRASLWKEHSKVSKLIWIVPECSPEERMSVPPQISRGPVHSFPSDFKEDLKLLLNWGVAACGDMRDGESQVVSALSSSRVHLTCPPKRRAVECFN